MLFDQLKHENWFDLSRSDGQISQARLHLQLQFVYNKQKYHKNVSERLQDQIKMTDIDLDDYKRDLVALYEPFLLLRQRLHALNDFGGGVSRFGALAGISPTKHEGVGEAAAGAISIPHGHFRGSQNGNAES
jgi:hypothetical protein